MVKVCEGCERCFAVAQGFEVLGFFVGLWAGGLSVFVGVFWLHVWGFEVLGSAGFGASRGFRALVAWALNVVPNLLQRVLMYGPLGCIRYMRGRAPFNGPTLRGVTTVRCSPEVRTASLEPSTLTLRCSTPNTISPEQGLEYPPIKIPMKDF